MTTPDSVCVSGKILHMINDEVNHPLGMVLQYDPIQYAHNLEMMVGGAIFDPLEAFGIKTAGIMSDIQ